MSAECVCVYVCAFVTDVCTCENHTSHFYPVVTGFVKVPLRVSGRLQAGESTLELAF